MTSPRLTASEKGRTSFRLTSRKKGYDPFSVTYFRNVQAILRPSVSVVNASLKPYLAMIMNAARVTLPPNTKPPLERFPRLGQGLVDR